MIRDDWDDWDDFSDSFSTRDVGIRQTLRVMASPQFATPSKSTTRQVAALTQNYHAGLIKVEWLQEEYDSRSTPDHPIL